MSLRPCCKWSVQRLVLHNEAGSDESFSSFSSLAMRTVTASLETETARLLQGELHWGQTHARCGQTADQHRFRDEIRETDEQFWAPSQQMRSQTNERFKRNKC